MYETDAKQHQAYIANLFNIYEPKFQFIIFTLANYHFIVWQSNVTLTFILPWPFYHIVSSVTLTLNLPEQMFQMKSCAKLFIHAYI